MVASVRLGPIADTSTPTDPASSFTDTASFALPRTARTPAGCSPPDLVTPTTSCPRLTASAATRLPIIPLAP
jgi:hypothetical protein